MFAQFRTSRLRAALALALMVVVTAAPAGAATEDVIDAYARQAAATWSVPGLQIAVVRDGRVVHVVTAGDDGRSPRDEAPPPRDEQRMPIASVGKQFTAAAILVLSANDKLALRDPIAKYVDVPVAWKDVTVYQLLTHTSGIPSYHEASGYMAQVSRAVTPRRLLDFAATQPPLFPAGTSWRYSNTNYILLGLAIEKIASESYAGYLKQTIFAPLGMRNTGLCAGPSHGFRMSGGRREPAPPVDPSQTWAAGGICSTAADIALWAAALDNGTLLDARIVRLMESPARLNEQKTEPRYGIGNELEVVNGHRVTGHQGSMLGYTAVLYRLPDDRISVAVLADQSSAPVSAIARHIAGLYVASLEAAGTIPDADPALTAKLRDVVLNAASGNADVERFAGGASNRNVAQVRRQGPSLLGPLGALKTFALIAAPSATERRYLASYERGQVEWRFSLDTAGRIVDFEPTPR